MALVLGAGAGFGQVLTGTLLISGAGCGCISGCDLSAYGGPVCGAGVVGNCAAGHLAMSVTIPIPDGCEVTATATMAPRSNGCTASGADGNSVTNDRLKVQGASLKNWTIGSNNASISDSHTQTGGSITVSGYANRADEIITYALYEGIPGCMMAFLPVVWGDVSLNVEDDICSVDWFTWTENNNSHFLVEVSDNGLDYEAIQRVEGKGTSLERNDYSTSFSTLRRYGEGFYLRLRQVDYNGQYSLSPVFYVPVIRPEDASLHYLPSENALELYISEARTGPFALTLYSAGGAILQRFDFSVAGNYHVALPTGFRGFVIAVLEDKSRGVLLSRKVSTF